MMRKCHLNTCPVGVATQDPVLRKRFTGQPEHVINYFFFVAEEVREIMAQLGFRTLRRDDRPGRRCSTCARGVEHWKARGVDLSQLFHKPDVPTGDVRSVTAQAQDHGLDDALDRELIAHGAGRRSTRGEPVPIDRADPQRQPHGRRDAVGRGRAALRPCRPAGRHDPRSRFTGTAGQSFGAFLARGVTLELDGDANDYVGKGLSGGRDHRAAAGTTASVDADGEHHRRQHRALRRDRGRGLFPRRRGRALRGAQLAARSRWSRARATTAANT